MSTTVLLVLVVALPLVLVAGGVWWGMRIRRDLYDRARLTGASWREGGGVLKRARAGPVPDDPGEREEMARMVRAMMENRHRFMRWAVPLFAVLAVLQAVLLASEPSVVGSLNVGLPLLLVAVQLWERRVLTRRMAQLTGGSPSGD